MQQFAQALSSVTSVEEGQRAYQAWMSRQRCHRSAFGFTIYYPMYLYVMGGDNELIVPVPNWIEDERCNHGRYVILWKSAHALLHEVHQPWMQDHTYLDNKDGIVVSGRQVVVNKSLWCDLPCRIREQRTFF